MRPYLTLAIVLLTGFAGQCQQFANVVNEQGIPVFNSSPFFGSGVSLYDFDGDGWDDLSFAMEDDSLRFFRNNFGLFEELPSPYLCVGDGKQITWADYDNDGDADFLLTVYLGTSKLFRNDGDWNFTDVSSTSGIPQIEGGRHFGASWYDYDKDGFLDVYICNYNVLSSLGTNHLLHNNGDGTFSDVAVNLGVNNGYFLSFQSVWMDYNNDGWGDLLVINDKENAANALFENNQNGTFTDVSEASGADILIDAMTASIADFDDNGYLDIYCTNEAEGNVLLSNNGDGTFSDLTEYSGLSVDLLTWGALWLDGDHNTDEDIYVTTTGVGTGNLNQYLQSNGDSTFSLQTIPDFTDLDLVSYSVAKGDWNNDGYWDFSVTNTNTQPSSLFENSGGPNHWLKVSLTGVISHPDAIGTWLKCQVGDQTQSIYTMNGENYIGQDSQHEIFSLGDAEMIDVLTVEWPSGLVEFYYGLDSDQHIELIEGATFSANITAPDDGTSMCPGDSLLLSVDATGDAIWMDGIQGMERYVTEAGEYYATWITPSGFEVMTDTVEVSIYDVNQIFSTVNYIDCYGELASIQLIPSGVVAVDSVSWNDGAFNGLQVLDIPEGFYDYSLVDIHGCSATGSIEIVEPPILEVEIITSDLLCFEDSTGNVLINASGGTGALLVEGSCPDVFCPAGFYEISIVDENACVLDTTFIINQPDPLEIALTVTDAVTADGSIQAEVQGGTEPYDFLWSNGGFSEVIDGLEAGNYSLWVIDDNGCQAFVEGEVGQWVGMEPFLADHTLPYPNPFRDQLNLNLPLAVDVNVFDLSGKSVLRTSLLPHESMDTWKIGPGSYTLQAMSSDGSLFHWMIVKR